MRAFAEQILAIGTVVTTPVNQPHGRGRPRFNRFGAFGGGLSVTTMMNVASGLIIAPAVVGCKPLLARALADW
jgi:hypothetical protein